MKGLGVLLMVLIFFSMAHAASKTEEYGLQERCHKSSIEWYRNTWGEQSVAKNDDGSSTIIYYTNHYNRKLNKCLVLQEIIYLSKDENDFTLVNKDLLDINENNKVYGHCIFRADRTNPKDLSLFVMKGNKTICLVSDIECHSVSEWDKMIKPYMEE
ncbi:MAG TPA: hypothetical protein VMT62_16465 [Syntrophorhabdaceae bacterium]|nr:hypothetical protein [Syntrophorhabdaceae bacterium]